ncbi:aspartyl-phosphate phosphatase Spo0E family protein [Bacillota bacterium Lsc_1132]
MCSDCNSRAVKMLEEIKAKRENMIKCASKNGFTNEMTIKLSQELDELINEYQRTFRAYRESEKAGRPFKKMVNVLPGKTLVNI